MTKKYVAFTDNVLPVNGYVSTDEGKIAKVVNDSGSYKLEVVDAGTASVTWSDVTSKPFSTIGTGLTVTSDVLTADTQFKFQIFTSLPTASQTYSQTIALILKTTTETGNVYDEYACVNTSGTTWSWEKIGATEFQLNITQTAEGISINTTALQKASASQAGLLTKDDWDTFNEKQDALTFDDTPTASSNNPVKSGGIKTQLDLKEDSANKVSSWSATTTDVHFPSEKLVKDSLNTKQDVSNLVTSFSATTTDTKYPSEKLVKDSLNGKTDLDTTASTVVFKIGCDSTGPYFDY